MARGNQFLELIEDLKADVGRSSDTSVGTDDLPVLKRQINRWYEALWYNYDWPFLKQTFDKDALSAGEQYYDYPDGLDLERIEEVIIWFNNIPYRPERGISVLDYATWDPANDERSDPVLKWDIRLTDDGEQIEVWPLPSSNSQYIQFVGYKQFATLVNDSDICYLDDTLVVSFAAAQILKRQKSEDAADMLAFANKHLNTLRRRGKVGKRTYQMGLGQERDDRFRPQAVVRVSQ